MAGEQQREQDAQRFRLRISKEHGAFFVGFAVWPADYEGWKLSSKERLRTGDRPLRRIVCNSPEASDARILIDVIECSSAEEAIDALLDERAANQLDSLPEGPPGLGVASFVHPAGVPPAVFFAHSNLCIRVISFARRAVDVMPWAERLTRRLNQAPIAERRALVLESSRTGGRSGEEVPLYYTLPWTLGEDGYLRFEVDGGLMTRKEGRLMVKTARSGQIEIKAYAAEPGRESYYGILTLSID